MSQLNLMTGLDKEAMAIKRLQDNVPLQGDYYLAFSGGADSVLTEHIVKLSGVPHTTNYAQTGIDPPELVKFIKEYYPQTRFHHPIMTMWRGIELKGLPTRKRRWCCQYLKHFTAKGNINITGIRWAESPRRKKYGEVSYIGKDKVVNPIIDWSTYEVWQYIKKNNIPYCPLYDNGFTRIGCLICTMASRKERLREAKLYPKIAEAYKRANRRFYKLKDKTEEEADLYFNEWLNFG